MTDLERVAWHESGHAVASHLLGHRGRGPVSILPGRASRGVCFSGRPERPRPQDLAGLDRPGPLLPARLRRFIESGVVVYLAGQVAEETWLARRRDGPYRTVRLPESPAEQVAEALQRLPAAEAEVLGEDLAADSVVADADRAAELLALLHGPRLAVASAHGRYLEAETRSLLGTGRAARMVAVLAAELGEHRALSAGRWRAVLAGVT